MPKIVGFCLGVFVGQTCLGEKFGEWTVVKDGLYALLDDGSRLSAVEAECSCGYKKAMLFSRLKSGETTKCRSCANKTHGRSRTSEHRTWEAMIRRCYVPHCAQYKDYGGRGVIVCDRWNPRKGGSFANFYKDMGPRPSKDHHLDKDIFDGNLIYSPDTCKWVHRCENAKRKRNAVWVEWRGEKVRLAELADELGIPVKRLWQRVKTYGMSVEEAIARG